MKTFPCRIKLHSQVGLLLLNAQNHIFIMLILFFTINLFSEMYTIVREIVGHPLLTAVSFEMPYRKLSSISS